MYYKMDELLETMQHSKRLAIHSIKTFIPSTKLDTEWMSRMMSNINWLAKRTCDGHTKEYYRNNK